MTLDITSYFSFLLHSPTFLSAPLSLSTFPYILTIILSMI